MNNIADFILSSFAEILEDTKESDVLNVGINVPIPFFDEMTLRLLLRDSEALFMQQPSLLRITGDVVVVGDLHGSLHDLLRIFASCGAPSFSACKGTRYLFLGDYVDRGAFSVEVIVLLLALHLKYPQNIYMIRGNHETPDTTEQYGFKDDIRSLYANHNMIYSLFMNVFACLPLACVVNKTVFCVHGGISAHLKSLEQIEHLQRPIMNDHSALIKDMLWADPCKACHFYAESFRGGKGQSFGPDALHNFLQENNLSLVVRAHQYNKAGVKVPMSGIITVFSASSYQFDGSNKSGILFLSESQKPMMRIMEPLNRMKREEATFFTMKYSGNGISRSQSVTFSVFSQQNEKIVRALKRHSICGPIPISKSIGGNIYVESTFYDHEEK